MTARTTPATKPVRSPPGVGKVMSQTAAPAATDNSRIRGSRANAIPRTSPTSKSVGIISTIHGASKHPTGLGQPGGTQLGDTTPERPPWQRVEVVEVDYAPSRYTVGPGGQPQLGGNTTLNTRQCRDNHRADAVGDRIPSEDEHGSVSTRRRRKPDLTSLHQPSPTSPRRGPNLRSQQAPALHRSEGWPSKP